MIDKLKSVTKDSFFYSIANMMNKIAGFILLPLYSAHFSIAEYGVLSLFDTMIDFMNIFTAFGIVEAFKRWYWEKESDEHHKSVFSTTLLFSLISAILFSIILYSVLRIFSEDIFETRFSSEFILIFIVCIIINIVMQRILILLRTAKLAKQNMIFNGILMTVTCVSTVIMITQFQLGLISVFLGRIIGITVTLAALSPRLIKLISFKINFQLLKEMLKFSYPLAVSSSLSLIFTISDRWLLKGLSTLESVGQYSLAYRVTNLIKLIVINSFIQAYVYSFFQKMHDQQSYNLYKKIVTYFTMAVMGFGLLLVGYSREMIYILTDNPSYYNSYKIIPFLMIANLFSGLRRILVLPFYKYKQTKFISKMAVTGGILNIGMNFVLIPILDSYGAALATGLAHLFVVIGYYWRGKKFKEFSYELNRFFMILVTGLIYTGILIYLNGIDSWMLILWKTVLLISYPLLLYAAGFYDPKEISAVKRAVLKFVRK